MISMSGNLHVWSKTYRKFYYGIVFIANEWCHIRIKNKVTACHDWHEWNILLPLLILCSHIYNLSTKIEYICMSLRKGRQSDNIDIFYIYISIGVLYAHVKVYV
jgi:hypothetical protein